MKRYLFALMLFITYFTTSNAQELDIIMHDLSSFTSSATSYTFAQDNDGTIWMTISYFGSGTEYKLLKYTNDTWSEVDFSPCTACTRAVIIDSEGNLYVASSEGLYKKNGDNWDTIWTGGWTQNLAADNQGNIWFRNASGLQFYNGSEVIDNSSIDGFSTSAVNLPYVVDAQNILWFITANAMHSFDGTTVTTYADISSPIHIAKDTENNIWVADNFGGIGYFENATWSGNLGLDGWPTFFGHTALVLDQNNVIWAGWQGTEGGVARDDGNSLHFWETEVFEGNILINYIFVDQDNKKWMASRNTNVIAEVDDSDFVVSTATPNNKIDFNITISPNPIADEGRVSYFLKEKAVVQVEILGTDGRLIQQLANEKQIMGEHTLVISTNQWPAGAYQVLLIVDGVVSSKSFILK